MSILTIRASKATPHKAIAYVTDRRKASLVVTQNMDENQDLANQMMQTMALWKGFEYRDPERRKYYHLKLSFHPDDWIENGGKLTEAEAMEILGILTEEINPTAEAIKAVHVDRDHLHGHVILSAIDLESGKMLDLRQAEYRRLKDRAQELCEERGLRAIDWRQAVKDKRAAEQESGVPVKKTFAEQGLEARGAYGWKEELRYLIDQALNSCSSMEEFQEQLAAVGVKLTRNSKDNISYKIDDHKAVRGDTLGDDYMAAAVRNALRINAQEVAPEPGKAHASLNALIGGASRVQDAQIVGSRVIKQAERERYRELGRLAGFKRAEIDEMCDDAPKATWAEKQAAWAAWTEARELHWAEYAVRQEAIAREIDAAYRQRRKARSIAWELDGRNRKASLGGVIFASIYLSNHESPEEIDARIQRLKEEQAQLRSSLVAFKINTKTSHDRLMQKGLSEAEYMRTVKLMQAAADRLAARNNLMLNEKERARIEKEVARKKAAREKAWKR